MFCVGLLRFDPKGNLWREQILSVMPLAAQLVTGCGRCRWLALFWHFIALFGCLVPIWHLVVSCLLSRPVACRVKLCTLLENIAQPGSSLKNVKNYSVDYFSQPLKISNCEKSVIEKDCALCPCNFQCNAWGRPASSGQKEQEAREIFECTHRNKKWSERVWDVCAWHGVVRSCTGYDTSARPTWHAYLFKCYLSPSSALTDCTKRTTCLHGRSILIVSICVCIISFPIIHFYFQLSVQFFLCSTRIMSRYDLTYSWVAHMVKLDKCCLCADRNDTFAHASECGHDHAVNDLLESGKADLDATEMVSSNSLANWIIIKNECSWSLLKAMLSCKNLSLPQQ